jgi:hypothetical protein
MIKHVTVQGVDTYILLALMEIISLNEPLRYQQPLKIKEMLPIKQ